MILSFLVALPTALSALLRGAWDVWAQSLLHIAVSLGLAAWLVSRIAIGYVPIPSRRALLWVFSLVFLSAVSFWSSPVPGLSRGDWYVALHALWLFPAMAALTNDERGWVDEAVRIVGWILMTLAFYQHFSLGESRPSATLINQNVYAGAVLMLLPLAVAKRDWLLAIGLVWTLLWTKSVGAWLGLAAALILTQRRANRFLFWTGASIAMIGAVGIYGRIGTPEVLHRWWWWTAAAEMMWDRPWTGFGPGSFAYVLPAYLKIEPGGLLSRYAHQYPLQTAAEFGLPYAVVWFAGIWRCVIRKRDHKRFAMIAVLVHSLWDYTLSLPSNLWLFSYFAASSMSDSPRGVNIAAKHKLPACVLVIGLGLAFAGKAWTFWRGHRTVAEAAEAIEDKQWDLAEELLESARRSSPDDPEIPHTAAALELRKSIHLGICGEGAQLERGDRGACAGSWLRIASHLEEAVRLNPYRPALWIQLAVAYRRLGQPEVAQFIHEESRRYAAR